MGLSRPRWATRASVAILAATFGLWMALLAVVALLLWNERQALLQEATLRGAATTALLQAHTANTFRAVDNVLVEVAKTLERDNLARHDAGLRNEMRKRLAFMPYVRAIFVIGPSGFIQHDTDHPATPDVSLADRPYFRQYLDGDAPLTPVSAPMLSRSGTGWFVAVTHRIGRGPDFRGVAVAAIQLAYFSDLYQKVGVAEGSEILLFHRDGRLIAQYPGTSGRVGESYARSPLFRDHLGRASWGTYLEQSGPWPHARIFNYAALDEVPLVVAQAQDMSEHLAVWRRWAIVGAVGLLLLLGAMMAGASQYLRARQDRQRQQERLLQGEKMEALGQLTGSIAHDFGNILGVLATNISLIRKLGADPRIAAALGRAERAVGNGTVLTRQLMSFSRKRELEVVDCDANAAIASVLALLEHAAGPHCKLAFEPGSLARPCRLDRAQFETALINLVVNARQAVEGQGCITIRTRSASGEDLHLTAASRQQRFVCVSVVDDGKGMPDEVRRRAVEPFFTTKGEGGTGFGLAQAYSMMEQLGGDLAIESRVGAGTSIHLCFPEASA